MNEDGPIQYSFVIPVFNEQESLEELHSQLNAATANLGRSEFLFIDDGCSDDSWKLIESLSRSDHRVSGIRFRRNFGKAAALSAGFQRAKGEIIFTLDADLQDDPAEIPHFLEKLNQGFDVVSGWKKIRHDPWHKVFPSRVFNSMVSRKTGIHLHDHNCGFKAYRRSVIESLSLYGERHRFVPVLAAAAGFKVGEVIIRHRKRIYGHSKYGWNRFVRGYLDLQTITFLSKYRYRPMHYFGTQYLVLLIVGVFGVAAGFILSILAPHLPIALAPIIGGVFSIIVAVQFYMTGYLAEHRLDLNPPREPYNIVETTRPSD